MAAPPPHCGDRANIHQLLGVIAGGAPPCHANRQNCQDEPVNHPHTPAHGPPNPRTVCDDCNTLLEGAMQANEHEQLKPLVVIRGGPGQPKFVTQALAMRSPLCKFCEADEQEQYKRNTALGAVAPNTHQDGWENTCTCYKTRVDLSLTGNRYCRHCRRLALSEIHIQAGQNRTELAQLARDNNGVRKTAGMPMALSRSDRGCPIACRCGRDTIPATMHPKATQCLCCGGVQVDASQVKVLRNTNANIAAASAAGTLPALQLVAANFNLDGRPPASRAVHTLLGANIVMTNNSRR